MPLHRGVHSTSVGVQKVHDVGCRLQVGRHEGGKCVAAGESGDFQHQWAVTSCSIAVHHPQQQGKERVGDAEGKRASSVESRERRRDMERTQAMRDRPEGETEPAGYLCGLSDRW